MLRYDQPKQLSFYSGLYEKIPMTFSVVSDRPLSYFFVFFNDYFTLRSYRTENHPPTY